MMKNWKLRIAWMIPNVFCYVMVICLLMFIIFNADGLADINRLSLYVLTMLVLLAVSIFGSFQIWKWVREGKI
ncbi:hypothetical protein [Pseudoneobacillus sp. C159]